MLIHRCLRRLLTSCIQLLLSFPALNPLTPILSPFHTTKLAHCKPFSLKIISPSTVLPTTPFLHTFSVYHLIDHVLFTTRLLHLSSYLRALHHPPQLHAFCTILLNYTPRTILITSRLSLYHPQLYASCTILPTYTPCTILLNHTPFAPSSSLPTRPCLPQYTIFPLFVSACMPSCQPTAFQAFLHTHGHKTKG